MQRPLRPRILAYFDLCVANMRQHLGLMAQVEHPFRGDRALFEMIGLGSISQPTGLRSASTWSLGSCTA
jgi:hypothetical protein